MSKTSYPISHFNNELKLFNSDKKEIIFSSFWFLEFGKTCAEIKNASEQIVYTITKKFQFWKWRMVYLIKDKKGSNYMLIAKNSRNTIFGLECNSDQYDIRVQYQKKKSIYKNDKKIAEFDESFAKSAYINLKTSDPEAIQIVFLLYTCLLIGSSNLKSQTALKSQKTLEKNTDPWF